MGKKIMGYGLLMFAGLLAFGTLVSLGTLLTSLGTFWLGIQGKASVDESEQALGGIFWYMVFLLVIYYAWKYGRKWTRKKEASIESNPQQ